METYTDVGRGKQLQNGGKGVCQPATGMADRYQMSPHTHHMSQHDRVDNNGQTVTVTVMSTHHLAEVPEGEFIMLKECHAHRHWEDIFSTY